MKVKAITIIKKDDSQEMTGFAIPKTKEEAVKHVLKGKFAGGEFRQNEMGDMGHIYKKGKHLAWVEFQFED